MIGIHRGPETLARTRGREGLKYDIIPSLEVSRAVLIGVNLRNSFLLAGCTSHSGGHSCPVGAMRLSPD